MLIFHYHYLPCNITLFSHFHYFTLSLLFIGPLGKYKVWSAQSEVSKTMIVQLKLVSYLPSLHSAALAAAWRSYILPGISQWTWYYMLWTYLWMFWKTQIIYGAIRTHHIGFQGIKIINTILSTEYKTNQSRMEIGIWHQIKSTWNWFIATFPTLGPNWIIGQQ